MRRGRKAREGEEVRGGSILADSVRERLAEFHVSQLWSPTLAAMAVSVVLQFATANATPPTPKQHFMSI